MNNERPEQGQAADGACRTDKTVLWHSPFPCRHLWCLLGLALGFGRCHSCSRTHSTMSCSQHKGKGGKKKGKKNIATVIANNSPWLYFLTNTIEWKPPPPPPPRQMKQRMAHTHKQHTHILTHTHTHTHTQHTHANEQRRGWSALEISSWSLVMKEMVEGLGLHKNAVHKVFFSLFFRSSGAVWTGRWAWALATYGSLPPSQIGHRVSVDVTSMKERSIILFSSNMFRQQNKEKCHERILQRMV